MAQSSASTNSRWAQSCRNSASGLNTNGQTGPQPMQTYALRAHHCSSTFVPSSPICARLHASSLLVCLQSLPTTPADTAGCFQLYLSFPERVCGQGPALLVSPGGNELLSGASPPAPDAQRGFLAAAALTQGKTRQHQQSVTHKRPSPVGSPVLHSDPEDPCSVHQKAPQINNAGWTAQPLLGPATLAAGKPSPHNLLGHPGAAAPRPCAQHLSEQPGSTSPAVRGLPEPAGIHCTQPAKKANRWNLFQH